MQDQQTHGDGALAPVAQRADQGQVGPAAPIAVPPLSRFRVAPGGMEQPVGEALDLPGNLAHRRAGSVVAEPPRVL